MGIAGEEPRHPVSSDLHDGALIHDELYRKKMLINNVILSPLSIPSFFGHKSLIFVFMDFIDIFC
jgi:hypothetical protein